MAEICDDPNRYIDGIFQSIAAEQLQLQLNTWYIVINTNLKKFKEANSINSVFYCFLLFLSVFAIGIAPTLAKQLTGVATLREKVASKGLPYF